MNKLPHYKFIILTLSLLVLFLVRVNNAESQEQPNSLNLGQDVKTSTSKPKEEIDPCDTKVEKVSKGTLATVGNFGSAGATVDSSTGGSAPGDEDSAVLGSIQYKSDTKCEAVLSNESECFKYAISFEVHSSKASGSFVTSGSSTLAPGAKKSVPFSCSRGLNYSLKITKSTSSKAKSK